jgi:hypothetical protein
MSPHQILSKYSIAIIWQFDGAARRVRFVQGANGTDAMFLYSAGYRGEFAGELDWPYEREKRK